MQRKVVARRGVSQDHASWSPRRAGGRHLVFSNRMTRRLTKYIYFQRGAAASSRSTPQAPEARRGIRRRRALWLSMLLGLALMSGRAWSAPDIRADPQLFEAIEKALSRGSAEDALASAGRQVEIRIFDRGTLYSKAQALYVLADFLKQHPPTRFVFTEYAASDDRRIAFGSYWAEGQDRPYAVYVNLRQRGDGWELRELRVEAPRGIDE